MKISKYTNYIQIEGLEEHNQGYDESNFSISKLDSSSVLFILEIVSPFVVKLNFIETVTDDVLIVHVKINGKSTSLLAEKPKDDIVEKPIIPTPQEEKFEYHFDDNNLVIENFGEIKKDELSIKIKKFNLERYDDFPDETILVDIPTDENGIVLKQIPFKIELDRIYRITTSYKGKVITEDYIHESPACYYSSIYHLKQSISKFDLYINDNKKTDFDLKLLIWKYSRMAVGIAGITGDVIYEHKNSLLNDFVEHRVMLDIIAQAIKEVNITPDSVEKSLGNIAVTLADLSHGAATTETVTTQLIKVHKELFTEMKDLEKNLRNYFSYLQTTKEINNELFNGKAVNRNNSFNPYLPRRRKYR